MRDRRSASHLLGRLLPADVRRDLFEPALHDLWVTHLQRMARASRRRRWLLEARLAALQLWLLVDCWRLVPRHVQLGWLEARRARVADGRLRKERVTVLLYTLRHALRLLVRERGFTAAAVLTLALGLGATLAIFTVVEAVMLRPLPYPDADDLVILEHRDRRTGLTKEFIALGDFVDLRARQQVFETLTSYGAADATVVAPGRQPFRANVLWAGPGLLELLRARPVRGRGFTEADARLGAPPVVILGHALWESAFGSDQAAIGRSIRVGTVDRQIVGIAPRAFAFPAGSATELIVPASVPLAPPAQRKSGWRFAIGRLEPGVTFEEAAAGLAAISTQMEAEHPQSNEGSFYFPVRLRDAMLGDTKRPLSLMLGAVAVVLLIACANVGNLLLARGLARRQEMAVRMALGAGRTRLVAQLVAEALVLTLVAGAVGVAIASWGAPALVALVPDSVAVPGLTEVGINPDVIAFALLLSMTTTVIIAVVSALAIRRENGASALAGQTRVTSGQSVRRATSAIVMAEVGLAVVLLVGGGLILRSFAHLLSIDPGFRIAGVATIEIELPSERYGSVETRRAFYDRAFAAVQALPDVRAAGAGVVVPLTGNVWTVPFERSDRPVPAGQRPPDVGWQNASGGYFRALQVPLLEGRLFDTRDAAGPPVVIVSRTLAGEHFGGESAVGRRLKIGNGEAEIVGVVGDIRRAALAVAPRADMYFPFERNPPGGITLFIRTTGDPSLSVSAIQQALTSVEPAIVIPRVDTLGGIAAQSIATTRLALWLLGIFGVVALALAAVGIYGVMSYLVRQRTREIGTRVALGAGRGDILWLVMRQGTAIAAAGLGAGLVAGIILTRFLGSILHGVSPTDPITLAGVVAVLGAATLAACYLPARRATRVDAARTLAGE